MKKIGILTINDCSNYGNRLQNYALQEYIRKIYRNVIVKTIENKPRKKFGKIRTFIGNFIKKMRHTSFDCRYIRFMEFDKNINKQFSVISENYIPKKMTNKYESFITGSDQVWNPKINRLSDIDLLKFARNNQKISFSASFGISKLPDQYHEKVRKELSTFKAISVREDVGKQIVEELTGRTDVEVLVDPTMLLTADEWDKVSKKPKQLHTDKYILNYFLGELSEERKNQINKIAKENNCEVINILDTNSPFYQTGPSEFLYLEKHAFLICTDSFHSCVFAILYNRPFIVFDRQDSNESMSSRLDTLLKKFDLEDRRYTGVITNNDLECNYCQVYEILEKEKKKANNFLKNALDNK